jgi:putative transcriptional regulator
VESLKGQLLVAAPGLVDPNFRRTVVLVTEHDDEGALGVILNRPAEATVAEAVPPLAGLVDSEAPVFVGGPVDQTSVIVLARFDDPGFAAATIFDDVGFVSGSADLDELSDAVRQARVFAGYAGWGSGQLDAELEAEDWITEPAVADDVFGPSDELWSEVLRRKGGAYALLATMPPDPSLN